MGPFGLGNQDFDALTPEEQQGGGFRLLVYDASKRQCAIYEGLDRGVAVHSGSNKWGMETIYGLATYYERYGSHTYNQIQGRC